jgi:hypothetical protein
MHGHSKKTETQQKVRSYLRRAVDLPPQEAPINYSVLQRKTGIDRRTVKKHMRYEIEQAIREQALNENGASPADKEAEAFKEQMRRRDRRIESLKETNTNLLVRLALVEANAQRLGIDPDELYKPLRRPDRSVSKAGQGGKRHKKYPS